MELQGKRVLLLLSLMPKTVWASSLAAEPFVIGLSYGQYLKTFAMLLVVLAVIGVLAYFINSLQRNMGLQNAQMRILAVLPLGPKERVVLIQVGEQALLLGQGQGGLTLLQNYADQVPLATTATKAEQPFQQLLQQFLHRGKG